MKIFCPIFLNNLKHLLVIRVKLVIKSVHYTFITNLQTADNIESMDFYHIKSI